MPVAPIEGHPNSGFGSRRVPRQRSGRVGSNGLTLVELLVVLGILAILAGLILSGVRYAQGKGQQSMCASNLHQLVMAIQMYAADHDDMAPPYHTLFSDPGDIGYRNGRLFDVLAPYIGDRRIWFCPSDPYAGQDLVDQIHHLRTSYLVAPPSEECLSIAPDWPVAHDGRWWGDIRLWHFDGFNLAYADGRVKWQPHLKPRDHYYFRLRRPDE